MSAEQPIWSRPLFRLTAVAAFSLFIAAPTPGNTGGCGGVASTTYIQPTGVPGEDEQYLLFDRGLCAHFCQKMRDCGRLCEVLGNPAGCNPDDPNFFAQCVRGPLDPAVVGVDRCPHACPTQLIVQPQLLTEMDILVCGDAITSRSCGDAVVALYFNPAEGYAPPAECTNVCQPP